MSMIELLPEIEHDGEVTLESLDSQHTVISLEAMTLSQVFEVNQSKLPRFLNDTMRFLKNKLSIFSPSVLNVDDRKLAPYLKTIDYATLMPLRVITLEKFNSTWLDYTNLLAKAHTEVMPIQTDLLKPFETFLGVTLNNPENMKSIANIASLPKRNNKDYVGLNGEFGKAFSGRPGAHLTYGEVVQRNADVATVVIGINNLNQDFAKLHRNDLIKNVNRISELLGLLMQKMHNKENEMMSGAFTKSLSDLTYAVAQDVEFYTTYGYRLESFTVSLKDSINQLVRFLSK